MMEDESASLDGKGLLNMRVVDLKLELEKRGLSKSGSKKDLVKRLKQQLEFEKLCEERKSGDFPSKLELDADIQQNEFVQQYLAQQQKRYAEREEEKRLELKAVQTGHEEGSTITSEHQCEGDENTSSDIDDKNDEKQNLTNNPSESESQTENTDDTNVTSLKSSESNIEVLHISESETKTEISGENISSQNPVVSMCDTDVKNSCDNTQTNGNQNIQNLKNIPEIEDTKLSISECLSETDTKSLITEPNTETDNPVCIADNIDDSKKQKHFEVDISNQSFDENISNVAIGTGNRLSESGKCQSNSSLTYEEVRDTVSHSVSPERASSEYIPKQKSPENMEVSADCSSVPYSLSDIQLPESPDCHVKSKDSKSEERNKVDHVSDELANENSHSDSKNTSNGEAVHKSNSSQEDDVSESETKDSSYSNDSPEKIKMTKNKSHSEESSDSESDRNSSPYKKKSFKDEDTSSNLAADSDNDHSKDTSNKEQKYVKAQHNSNESDNEKSSDSEKSKRHVDSKRKSRDKSSDSEKYNRHVDSKRKSRDNEKSSDSEKHNRHVDPKRKTRDNEKSSDSDKHNRHVDSKRKSRDNEKSSDSEKYNRHVDSKRKAGDNEKSSDSEKYNRHVDSKRKSGDNEKSSDSEKYNRHVDSKRKSRDKRRKRDSRTSSSSSSRSSDSSSERRHSKKAVAAKNKDFAQDNESNQLSDKSSDEKSITHKKNDSATESPTNTTVLTKKRLKIKRDNVPIELPSPKKEPLSPTKETSTSNKNIERNSSSHSVPDKPLKQESIEEKEEENLEINYKPRKVVLSNRKINRSSFEDNSIEPRFKKNKWESFASAQKSSHAYSISTDSLRNWFPDFKLVSETSMEVEQDEHSLSAIDEKNGDAPPDETLNENESNLKQESSSQMDMEDSVSEEPNFDDTAELGPVSKIIFIQNLVRPFTLNQLKDLLKQSGKIVEEYFWIDKIKSKCFVMYETEKEAIKARKALNNTRWPSSNPKILSVEFSDIEELEKHQKGNESQPLKPPEPPAIESTDTLEARVSHTVEEHKRKDRERRKEKDRSKLQAPIREWDKDKIVQDSPERERPPKEEKPRNAEKKEKKESKKRATEDTPAKLLDDLFQKTKSVPCIYWLPLTEEQAKAKEEEKKTRRLEREKRNQQLKEQEEAERRSRRARSGSRRREKENRKSSTRSRSPVSRRR